VTLELGASSWLKKSLRVLDKSAFFHPLTPHRTERVLRRHVQLFEFLQRAAHSWDRWALAHARAAHTSSPREPTPMDMTLFRGP
jgi:hypothetical protein